MWAPLSVILKIKEHPLSHKHDSGCSYNYLRFLYFLQEDIFQNKQYSQYIHQTADFFIFYLSGNQIQCYI